MKTYWLLTIRTVESGVDSTTTTTVEVNGAFPNLKILRESFNKSGDKNFQLIIQFILQLTKKQHDTYNG